jgi:hypothetical protein
MLVLVVFGVLELLRLRLTVTLTLQIFFEVFTHYFECSPEPNRRYVSTS